MKITSSTTVEEVSNKTKNVMELGIIPNMLLKNAGKPNGFVTEEKDYKYWLKRVCDRHE